MNEPTQAVVKKEAASVEYVPYGAQDKIKMTVAIIQNLIAVKTRSGATCSERDAIKFMAMCQAKRINPFEGDTFLIGYDTKEGPSFSLVTAHQTYLKRAELHPEFDGMKSGVIVREQDGTLRDLEGDFFDEGQTVVGGWATVYFKNRKQVMHKRLRLKRFQKPFGVWQEDPAGMICKCAEADALRSSFPTMLGGLYLREEIEVETLKNATRPMFTTPTKPTLLNGTGVSEESPEPPSAPPSEPSETSSAAPEPAIAPDATLAEKVEDRERNLKALRKAMKIEAITDGALLDFLSGTGATDGSQSSLEEVPLEVLSLVYRTWKDVASKIKAGKEGLL